MRKNVLIYCILVLFLSVGSFILFKPTNKKISKTETVKISTESSLRTSNKFNRVQPSGHENGLVAVETNKTATNRVRIGFNFVPKSHVPIVE